jgi:hypothetical protein
MSACRISVGGYNEKDHRERHLNRRIILELILEKYGFSIEII